MDFNEFITELENKLKGEAKEHSETINDFLLGYFGSRARLGKLIGMERDEYMIVAGAATRDIFGKKLTALMLNIARPSIIKAWEDA